MQKLNSQPKLLPRLIIDAEYCVEREVEDFATMEFDFEAHKPKILEEHI